MVLLLKEKCTESDRNEWKQNDREIDMISSQLQPNSTKTEKRVEDAVAIGFKDLNSQTPRRPERLPCLSPIAKAAQPHHQRQAFRREGLVPSEPVVSVSML